MLLALVDYACYREQWGRYRASQLEAAGYKRATPENFADEGLRPGDCIIFHTRRSALSWLIMYVTNSVASHVATMVDKSNVVEAVTSGTVRHPFSDLLDGQSYLTTFSPPGITNEQRVKVAEAADKFVGTQFDWYGTARLGARHVVWAKYAQYNPRLYADTAIVLLAVGRVGLHRAPTWSQLVPALIYGLAVVANRTMAPFTPLRAKSKLRRAAQQVPRADGVGAAAVASILSSSSRHAPEAAIAAALQELERVNVLPEEKLDDLARLLRFAQKAKDKRVAMLGTVPYGHLMAVRGGPDEVREARTAFQGIASEADPRLAVVGIFGLGLSLEAHDPAGAMDAYRQVADLGDEEWSPVAGVNLSLLLLRHGEIEEALRVLSWTASTGHRDAAARAVALLEQIRSVLQPPA